MLSWPPEDLMCMIQNIVRSEYIKQSALGEKYTDLRFFWGKGYIDGKSGKLKVEYPKSIAGYFVFMAGDEYRETQINFINTTDDWLKYQFWHNKKTFIPMIQSQIDGSRTKLAVNQALLGCVEYDQIKLKNIDEGLLTYEEDDE